MTATRIVTFLLVVSLLLFAACETDLPPLPDDPPTPGDEGETNIAGQAISTGDERFSESQFYLRPNPAEIPTRINIISNDTIIWSSGYISLDAGEWTEFTLAGERVQDTNWLRAGAQTEIPLDEQTPATENNYAIIYSCNLENNQWDCRENKWQMQQFTTESACEEGEIIDNQICTDGELIELPGTPEGPGNLEEPSNPITPDRCTIGAEFSCEDFAVLDKENTTDVRIELVNHDTETVYFDSFTITDSTGTTQCLGGYDGPGNAGISARPGSTATLSCNIENNSMETQYVANFTVGYMRGQETTQRTSEGSLRVNQTESILQEYEITIEGAELQYYQQNDTPENDYDKKTSLEYNLGAGEKLRVNVYKYPAGTAAENLEKHLENHNSFTVDIPTGEYIGVVKRTGDTVYGKIWVTQPTLIFETIRTPIGEYQEVIRAENRYIEIYPPIQED